MESTIKKVDETIVNLCDFINDGIRGNKALHNEIGVITGNLASLIQARTELSKGTQSMTYIEQEKPKRSGARMRTIENAVALIKEEDPESDVTASLLRKAIKDGKIPVVKAGTKSLLDVDSCLEKLYQLEKPQEEIFVDRPIIQPSKEGKRHGKIRPVSP